MTMKLVDKVLALQAVAPFSILRPDELLTIATACGEQLLGPGQLLCREGSVLQRLYVRVEGTAVDRAGTEMQPSIGTTMLLTGKPAPFDILAGPLGLRALSLPRGKFFTVIVECPGLLTGFFRMPLLGVDYLAETSE